MATVSTTNVWIVEWLHPPDKKTGHLLHEWMEQKRLGWSVFNCCDSKDDVLNAIERATICAAQSGMLPVLHLEAHGDHVGLEGPDGRGGVEVLTWDELSEPLQRLNRATRCNLVVLVAACVGFAAIGAFRRGPRAPAVALVGPDDDLNEGDLLRGTKEFYRRWCDSDARLSEAAESASREAGAVQFEIEPFAVLAFEALTRALIISSRSAARDARSERVAERMRTLGTLSNAEIDAQLSKLPALPTPSDLQLMWDELFMIDLWPANGDRFGVNMSSVIDTLSRAQ